MAGWAGAASVHERRVDWCEYTIDALLDLPAAGLIKKLLDLNYPEELTTTYASHGVMQPEPESDP